LRISREFIRGVFIVDHVFKALWNSDTALAGGTRSDSIAPAFQIKQIIRLDA
jgi:hypothetical protein